MPNGIRLDAQGFDTLLDRIRQAPDKIRKIASTEVKAGSKEMAATAKSFAPADVGILRNSIGSEDLAELSSEVFATADYAAYVEFGTGTKVFATDLYSFAENERAYARQFFVSGKGYMPPAPFFFRAGNLVEPQMVKRIADALDKQV